MAMVIGSLSVYYWNSRWNCKRIRQSLHTSNGRNKRSGCCNCELSKHKAITLKYINVQRQSATSDCGLFALAFATSLLDKVDPEMELYNQKLMRQHLLNALEKTTSLLFPL